MAIAAEALNPADEILMRYFPDALLDMTDITRDVLREAFPMTRRGFTPYEKLNIDGMEVDSWRIQVGAVGALAITGRSRGGFELSDKVTGMKITEKAAVMDLKHLLGKTDNVGGKSGACVTTEMLLALGPRGRVELFRQHAEAHDINPKTNIVATDIGTFGPDMDAVAATLLPKYGDKAGAAASGASEKYGGDPKFHAPHTGRGATILLEEYFASQADTNPRIRNAINRPKDAPLLAIVQGVGKAGYHTINTLPDYVQVAGVLEKNGGMIAKDGVLDREQVLHLARTTQLSQESVEKVDGVRWLPPNALSEFWAIRAQIAIPAFDRNQFTADDARAFEGDLVLEVANSPLSADAHAILNERGIDVVPDAAANVGGTISSQVIWENIMYNRQLTEADWERRVRNVAATLLLSRTLETANQGMAVSLPDTAKIIALRRAVERLNMAA